MGMVNRVVPRADLESTVEEFAAHVAKAPLSTLMATKQLVSRAWELMGMRMHWKMSTDVMAVVAHTSDAQAARMEAMSRGQKPSEKAAEAAATNEPASTDGV